MNATAALPTGLDAYAGTDVTPPSEVSYRGQTFKLSIDQLEEMSQFHQTTLQHDTFHTLIARQDPITGDVTAQNYI